MYNDRNYIARITMMIVIAMIIIMIIVIIVIIIVMWVLMIYVMWVLMVSGVSDTGVDQENRRSVCRQLYAGLRCICQGYADYSHELCEQFGEAGLLEVWTEELRGLSSACRDSEVIKRHDSVN